MSTTTKVTVATRMEATVGAEFVRTDAGAVAGYFLGAHYSQRIPQRRVRQIITAVGFAISGVMFYLQFR